MFSSLRSDPPNCGRIGEAAAAAGSIRPSIQTRPMRSDVPPTCTLYAADSEWIGGATKVVDKSPQYDKLLGSPDDIESKLSY